MKRSLKILFLLCLIGVISISALTALLSSSYSSQLVNKYLLQYIPLISSSHSLEYNFPNHIRLEGVRLKDAQQTYVNHLELSFQWQWNKPKQITLQNITLDGANVQQQSFTDFSSLLATSLPIQRLTLKNIDFAYEQFIIRNLHMQLINPVFSDSGLWGLPFGELQLQAEQVYWQGEALNHLSLDMDHLQQSSAIYSLTFSWDNATISTQAEHSGQGWRLLNTQIDKLNLNSKQLSSTAATVWSTLKSHIFKIENITLNNANIVLPNIQTENLQLNVQNIQAPWDLWSQDTAYLSLNADNILWLSELWVSPIADLRLNPQQIAIEQLFAEFHQGNIQLRGNGSPNALHLQQFSASKFRWHIDQPQQLSGLLKAIETFEELYIDELSINNGQIIHLVNSHHWQVSGLNVTGTDLKLKQKHELALWQGKLSVSANTMNALGLYSEKPWLEMHNKNQHWHIQPLFLPLEKGAIELKADMDLSTVSRPWKVDFSGFNIPNQSVLQAFELPVHWQGYSDIDLKLTGLGGDNIMLSHSLSGTANITLRDTSLELSGTTALLPISSATAYFDRGRFKVEPSRDQQSATFAQFSGEGDLMALNESQLNFEVSVINDGQCFSWVRNILTSRTQLSTDCNARAVSRP